MLPQAHAFGWESRGILRPRAAGSENAHANDNTRDTSYARNGLTAASQRAARTQQKDTTKQVIEAEASSVGTSGKTFALWIPDEQGFRRELQTTAIYDWEREKTPARRSLFRQAKVTVRAPPLPRYMSLTPSMDVISGVTNAVWHRTVNALLSTQNCDPLFTLSVGTVYYQRIIAHAKNEAAAEVAHSPPGTPMADLDPPARDDPASAWSINQDKTPALLTLNLTMGTAPRVAAALAAGPKRFEAYFHYEGGSASTAATLNLNSSSIASNGFCAALVQREQDAAVANALGRAAPPVDICAPRRVHVLSPDGRNLLFMAAHIIAMKMYDDLHLANRYMSHFFDVPLATVNASELTALKLLGFSLNVPRGEQRLMKAQITQHMEMPTQAGHR